MKADRKEAGRTELVGHAHESITFTNDEDVKLGKSHQPVLATQNYDYT